MKRYFLFFASLAVALLSSSFCYAEMMLCGETITHGLSCDSAADQTTCEGRRTEGGNRYCRWEYADNGTTIGEQPGGGVINNGNYGFTDFLAGECLEIPCNSTCCMACAIDNPNVCLECPSGYIMSGGTCKKIGEHIPLHGECIIDYCLICKDSGTECVECMAYHELNATGTRCSCTKEHCTTCDAFGVCETCEEGYHLDNGDCVADTSSSSYTVDVTALVKKVDECAE